MLPALEQACLVWPESSGWAQELARESALGWALGSALKSEWAPELPSVRESECESAPVLPWDPVSASVSVSTLARVLVPGLRWALELLWVPGLLSVLRLLSASAREQGVQSLASAKVSASALALASLAANLATSEASSATPPH